MPPRRIENALRSDPIQRWSGRFYDAYFFPLHLVRTEADRTNHVLLHAVRIQLGHHILSEHFALNLASRYIRRSVVAQRV